MKIICAEKRPYFVFKHNFTFTETILVIIIYFKNRSLFYLVVNGCLVNIKIIYPCPYQWGVRSRQNWMASRLSLSRRTRSKCVVVTGFSVARCDSNTHFVSPIPSNLHFRLNSVSELRGNFGNFVLLVAFADISTSFFRIYLDGTVVSATLHSFCRAL